MASPAGRVLRNLGRGVVGGLILGTPFLFTMETWWHAWTLPLPLIAIFAFAGLAIVLVLVRAVGFVKEETHRKTPLRRAVLDFAELTLQSFAAAFVVLFLFGVATVEDPIHKLARLGLVQVVPLGLGAAVANHALAGDGEDDALEKPFPHDVALFALGALFFTLPIAPTEEMDLMATRAGWLRLGLVVLASLLLAYLSLYVLEFRGKGGRRAGMGPVLRLGEVSLVYATAFLVAAALLALFGHFAGTSHEVWVQKTIVLAFPATLGGSAARVVF